MFKGKTHFVKKTSERFVSIADLTGKINMNEEMSFKNPLFYSKKGT